MQRARCPDAGGRAAKRARVAAPCGIAALPDEVLIKIFQYVLVMKTAGEVSGRVRHRFAVDGRAVACTSRRFLALMRRTVTAVEASPRWPNAWVAAMVVFARRELQRVYVPHPACHDFGGAEGAARFAWSSQLCHVFAATAPPLTVLSVHDFAPAPFEHVAAMLKALPTLKEITLRHPRPQDLAAISRTCLKVEGLYLGAGTLGADVDELRRQFVSLLNSPVGRRLKTLHLPWTGVTMDVFGALKGCTRLERFRAELGVVHWIQHSLLQHATLDIDIYVQQRKLFRAMIAALSSIQSLRSFMIHSSDSMPAGDLELIFSALPGLEDLDIFATAKGRPPICDTSSFDKLVANMSPTLKRLNIAGVSFKSEHIEELAQRCKRLESISVWMAGGHRPSLDVFKALGSRVKHLSILCNWATDMAEAVATHNTNLESIFLVAESMPMSTIKTLIAGVGDNLKKFQMFISKPALADGIEISEAADMRVTKRIVNDAARLVARDCAASLEVLNIGGSRGKHWFVDCTDIARELRCLAPHLWQICVSNAED